MSFLAIANPKMKSPQAISRPLPSLAAGLLAISFNLHAQEVKSSAPVGAEAATLTLNLDQPGAAVSPTLYGLMTEEINHSYDGGLYAELIQNRVFKDDAKAPAHWSLVKDGGGSGEIALDQSQAINDALTTCLKLEVTNAGKRVGIANDGYWGVPVKPATAYRVSFYAKSAGASSGPLTVSIESNDGATVYAQAQAPSPGNQWKQFS